MNLRGHVKGSVHGRHQWRPQHWPLRGIAAIPFWLLAATPATAQIISGRLLDAVAGEPVTGADILLLSSDDRVVARSLTDDDGSFLLRAPEPGWYQLRAASPGYGTTSPPFELVASDSLEVEFRATAEPVLLAPLTVVARTRRVDEQDARLKRRGYYDRRTRYGKEGIGSAHFLEGDDLRPTALRVTDLLRDLHGVYVSSAGGRRTVVTGRRGCPLAFYIDGTFAGYVEDGSILPTAIRAMEVYPSGTILPAEFMGTSLRRKCGAVAVWTGVQPR